ncbi:MAG TPA: DUF455 family protein [Myxococcota bacterium]|nr:DUF455 family protein [Myxococcota bacterium]
MTAPARELRNHCLEILQAGDLARKLAPPLAPDGSALPDATPGEPLYVPRPARAPELEMRGGAARLPRPAELGDPRARAACLRRFAHHELMAVELFAWALLRWPDAPPDLRRGWAAALADEQRHCRMYLERLYAYGEGLADEPLSDYFWKHAPAIHAHARGPAAFLAAMGLTLEQANLDFTALYAEGFRRAGDEASAAVSEAVHRDECRHVALAVRWLARLAPAGESDVQAYSASVPFPLEASRAKGRRFDAAARREAGLSEAMIAHVRDARATQESRPRRQSRR